MSYWGTGRDPPAWHDGRASTHAAGGDPHYRHHRDGSTYQWERRAEGEGLGGPSNYARKAWIGGLERHRLEGGEEGRIRQRVGERGNLRSERVMANGDGAYGGSIDSHGEATNYGRCLRVSTRQGGRRKRDLATVLAVSTLGLLPGIQAAPPPLSRHAPISPSPIPTASPVHQQVNDQRQPSASPLLSPSAPSSMPTDAIPTQPPIYVDQKYAQWPGSGRPPHREEGNARRNAKRDGVKYLTSAEPPTAMPTATMNVPESALPYLLRQGDDGEWTRVGEGWKLYGRQVGDTAAATATDPQVTQTATWAVESALPPGWGSQSTRTDFYRVPLIVVAAVVLAVSIVVWIAVTAFKRRKAHRRQKRRAERLRRRALAAAGISESDARTEEAQRKFEEKLDELQRERRMKKGEKFGKSGTTGRSRDRENRDGRESREARVKQGQAKVRVWNAALGLGGLRRRKGARGAGAGRGAAGAGEDSDARDGAREGGASDSASSTPRPGSVVLDTSSTTLEPKPEDPALAARRGERGSQDTDRSTPTVPSSHTANESGLPSREHTTTEDSMESRDRMSSLGSMRTRESPGSDLRDSGVGAGAGAGGGQPAYTGAGGATYFPPAYRPASVRSLPAASSSRYAEATGQEGDGAAGAGGHDQSSSRAIHTSDPAANNHGSEKVHAPGYYPAPSTAEGEVALAVASRAEGKQRMPMPDVPDLTDGVDEGGAARGTGVGHTGHVATDDKRVLEQMRLAASAPPVREDERAAVEASPLVHEQPPGADAAEGQSGPSAPHIETDQDGFETLPLDLGAPFTASDAHHSSAPPNGSSTSMRQAVSLHPDLPLPPSRPSGRIRTLSMREEVEREVHEQLDELNLLPSAPPMHPGLGRATSVPSAPPGLDLEGDVEEDEDDGNAGEGGEGLGDGGGLPSAPSMLDEEENDEAREHDGATTAMSPGVGAIPTTPRLGLNTASVPGSPVVTEDRPRVRAEGRFLPRYEP